MKKVMIKPAIFILSLICVFAFVGFYACSKSGGYGNNGGNNNGNTVSIKNFAFSVGTLTVASGTTVTWTNNDGTTHTVTADDNSFDSGNIAPGGTFSHKFTSAGTVAYHCAIHTSMKASIVVN
jgi:plastocyanin